MPKEKTGKKISALGLIFLGLGSVIGSSFFLGSGIAIQMSGPSVVLGYLIGGVITYIVLVSLGHLALRYKDRESYRGYVYEAIGPTSGFVIGWSTWLMSVVGMMTESIAMSIYTRVWFHQIPIWVLVFVYILLAGVINFWGIKVVDKSEGILTIIKTGALLIFAGIVIYMVFVIRPNIRGIGIANLTPFLPRGLGGLAQATVICTFAYGIGALAAAAGRTKNPAQDVPKATIGMTVGQMFFFTIPTLSLLFAIPWTMVSTKSSPFVSALNHIGIHFGGLVLNVVVLFASLSTLVAALFSGVIMLTSLANDREAPSFLVKQWKSTPIFALLISIVFALLFAWLAEILTKNIYNYAVSTMGYLSFINWGFILLSRMALCLPNKNQGRMEWSGFTVAILGLGALLLISILSLQAHEQVIPFILSIVSLITLAVAGKLIMGKKA